MKREELQREIARLDDEINRVISSVELPKLDVRPFPTGTWLFAFLCLAWWLYGYKIPGAYDYHLQTSVWAFRLGALMAMVALLSTISWVLRGRGYQNRSDAYTNASRKARELQERRKDLQAELRSLTQD